MDTLPSVCGIGGTLSGSWDYGLVILSCMVAIAGSFAGLDCADRMRLAENGRDRRRYFIAGAALIGVSVWTMHFIGMLAHELGIQVGYDPTLSIVSMIAAAFGAGLAFLVMNRPAISPFHVLVGGLAMGLAIASMHYLGMASMRISASIDYDPPLFVGSVALAIAASTGALALARRPERAPRVRPAIKVASAVVLGAAIAGMHYVGMAAARYVPSGENIAGEGATVGSWSLDDLLVGAGMLIAIALMALTAKTAAERQAALDSLAQKRDEALAASRAKDEFLASLSHELRTPLNPALLLATDAAARADFPPAAREAFSAIAQQVALEARLIDDLLDLTRISRGVLKLERRTVDVHRVLRDALRTIEGDARVKGLELQMELRATQSYVDADPDRLQQVFWNLLQNAAKFSPRGGIISVDTRNAGERIEVAVVDRGLGMSAEEVSRSFEPFVQGGHQLGGLGLGLAISRSIVELHGGRIVAESAGRGSGSTFTVRLQTVKAPSAQSAPTEPGDTTPAQRPAGVTVLLVEDHEASRLALERLLARRGYRVTSARTMTQALHAAAAEPFDVLVSDIGLPDGDGYQLMRTLRARGFKAGIAVTGYGMDEDVRRAEEAGFVAHVIKPVTVSKLEAALARVVPPGTVPLTKSSSEAG